MSIILQSCFLGRYNNRNALKHCGQTDDTVIDHSEGLILCLECILSVCLWVYYATTSRTAVLSLPHRVTRRNIYIYKQASRLSLSLALCVSDEILHSHIYHRPINCPDSS